MLHPSTVSNVRYKFAINNTTRRRRDTKGEGERERCRWLRSKIGVDRTRDHERRIVRVNHSVALSFPAQWKTLRTITVTNGNPGNSAPHRSRRWAEQRTNWRPRQRTMPRINLLFVMAIMTCMLSICYLCSLSWLLLIALSRLPVFPYALKNFGAVLKFRY